MFRKRGQAAQGEKPLDDRVNNHSPPIKRYLMTMACAVVGATIALYVSSLENNAIEKATLESHLKQQGMNVSKLDLEEQVKRMKAFRRNNMRNKHNISVKSSIQVSIDKPIETGPAPVRIALIGERHTGTRWIMSELQHCFPQNHVRSRLTRWKHSFQDAELEEKPMTTLVVATFRNPYEWLEAMRKVPHNAPNHFGLEWKEFLTKEWGMERPKRDLELQEKEGKICFEKFSYDEVISCVEGSYRQDEDIKNTIQIIRQKSFSSGYRFGYKPVYELKRDKSGKPYPNILKFRTAKINNFLEISKWSWVKDLVIAQYENLLQSGTNDLISQIENILNVNRSCTLRTSTLNFYQKLNLHKRNVTQQFVDYVDQHLDWETEQKIGYHKRAWLDDKNIIQEEPKLTDETSKDVDANDGIKVNFTKETSDERKVESKVDSKKEKETPKESKLETEDESKVNVKEESKVDHKKEEIKQGESVVIHDDSLEEKLESKIESNTKETEQDESEVNVKKNTPAEYEEKNKAESEEDIIEKSDVDFKKEDSKQEEIEIVSKEDSKQDAEQDRKVKDQTESKENDTQKEIEVDAKEEETTN